MPKIMPLDVADALIIRVAELYNKQQTKPSIVFHGGEPLLSGAPYLRRLTDLILNETPNAILSIQSNGTIYSKDVEDFLRDYKEKITFSISADGFKEENDLHRRGLKGQSLYKKIERTILLSSQSTLLKNILLVVDVNNSPDRIYDFMKSCNINSFNIILPDGDYNKLPHGKKALGSTAFGSWLWDLFKMYATMPSNFRIKFFDDIAKGILKNKIKAASPLSTFSICTMTVDTNGEIKQSDTFRINGDGADVIGKFNIKDNSLVDVANSEENIKYIKEVESLPSICLTCRHLSVCGGGYPSHRLSGTSFKNPSIYCADYKYLFERMEVAIC